MPRPGRHVTVGHSPLVGPDRPGFEQPGEMPATPDPVREAASAAVKLRGVPQIARTVGIGHQTLRKYVNGGRVRGDVLGKLVVWHKGEDLPEREPGGYYGSGA